MKSRYFLFLIFSMFLSASAACAQVPITVGGLDVSVSNENPAPGQTVILRARSYTIDINTSVVSWSVNGKQVQSGIGLTTLEIIAPVLGKKFVVTVSAATTEGRTVTASVTIGSGSVDMITETDGYAPTFFRGKLGTVYQNTVKVIAVPHLADADGVEYDPKTLIYQWKKNERVIEEQSGYGKQSVSILGDIVPRPYTVSVSVWPRDNSARAQGIAYVTMESPTVGFYIDDPLYGPLFNKMIGAVVNIGSEKETSVLAVPYGFNRPISSIGSLAFSWVINGIRRDELSSNQSVVLRAPEGSAGSSSITLGIKNAAKILQGASGGFSAAFSQEKSSSLEEPAF
ncbi:MAG: hypothetical protein AAB365_03320 [Patescibacteria group bacterium]